MQSCMTLLLFTLHASGTLIAIKTTFHSTNHDLLGSDTDSTDRPNASSTEIAIHGTAITKDTQSQSR